MTDGAPEGVFRLVYRSRCRIPAERRRAALGELFLQARANNKRRHVTGALLVQDDCFVQTLEGAEPDVRALFAAIEVDARHEAVSVLETRIVPDRVFARWAMAEVAEQGSPQPLIAAEKGIARAAVRGDVTAEQEALLEDMRQAARTDLAPAQA